MFLILLAALAPVLLLASYIYFKDPQPEPIGRLVGAFLGGVAICVPVAVLENLIQNMLFIGGEPVTLFGSTALAFLVAAIPEEGAKLFVLWLVLRKNPYFDEHFDGIVYAVFVSLGFAAIENVFYLFGSPNWLTVAIGRAFLAVPGHYAFGIMMGYYYTKYHFINHSARNAMRILLIPVLAHGVYDAIALSGTVNPYVGAFSSILLIYFCIKLQRNAYNKVQQLAEKL